MIMSVPLAQIRDKPASAGTFIPRADGEMAESPHTRFVRSGGIDLAYQVVGAGEDMFAVMDAAGSARACVAGWADGAFMAAMFAATYPDRVSALVLGGLWLRALAGQPETLTPDPRVAEVLSAKIEAGWRHGVLAEV